MPTDTQQKIQELRVAYDWYQGMYERAARELEEIRSDLYDLGALP